MATFDRSPPVLILGAGIHGVAIARELVLNGVPVVLIDRGDLAAGATSKSSRLIHGGLRYLEFGDVRLVRESLAERRRNIELAPYFVEPLRLYIPVLAGFSGLITSAAGFFGMRRQRWLAPFLGASRSRGFWPVRVGLSMYDWLASDSTFPPSRAWSMSQAAAASDVPLVDSARYPLLLAYSDAQMRYPERVAVALLQDTRAVAETYSTPFELVTYAGIERSHHDWEIKGPLLAEPLRLRPSLVINASGAAGDATLASLGIVALPLWGGTKGSHLLTWHAGLRTALRGQAVYAEAADGRPVFTLPFGDGVLIGTTDVPFTGDPEEAVATDEEIEYLLAMVQHVFGIALTRDDVVATYSGVRPLPRSDVASTAAISRDHALTWHETPDSVPVLSLVGGKLTTWRSFADEITSVVLQKLSRPRIADTTTRRLPGQDVLPYDGRPGPELWQQWAQEFDSSPEEVAALWPLIGTQLTTILGEVRDEPKTLVADTPLTGRVVKWFIQNESVLRLEDLVERRLMTVFQERLSRQHLADLARCLVETGRLAPADFEESVEHAAQRLARHYSRKLDPQSSATARD